MLFGSEVSVEAGSVRNMSDPDHARGRSHRYRRRKCVRIGPLIMLVVIIQGAGNAKATSSMLEHRVTLDDLFEQDETILIPNPDHAVSKRTIPSAPYGLTAYGEPCKDRCKHRGFPYTWCHKRPSHNGTWVDRDYCSSGPGVTRYQEACVDACAQRDRPFYACATRPTVRGDWDYCSPFSLDSCAWSAWGSWSACSATCGSRSSRTRRRRMEEGGGGRVGECSGEIEQSIRSCRMPECIAGVSPNFESGSSSSSCDWLSWSEWTDCSVSCGRGGRQTRKRSKQGDAERHRFGAGCDGPDHQDIKCNGDPCEDLNEAGETTTFPSSPSRTFLGRLSARHHGVSGSVYALGKRRLQVTDFHYDGAGPDAFFWAGTESRYPSDEGVLLPYPFDGTFRHYTDQDASVLEQHEGTDITLTLPPEIEVADLKWISVWCRRFSVNFGDLVIEKDQPAAEGTLCAVLQC
jgi:hypothetical protein